MSSTSATQTDMSAFERQFDASIHAAPTSGQLRVRGWIIALVASVILWAGIAVAIVAAFHAL
jgi:hypothetical protein